MRHLFWGGVHPAGRKELSRGAAPTPAPLPSQVVIPMVQHIGKPCTPLVKAGEPVKLGQKIGDAEGLSATIHASVSGTVAAVEPRPHPSGRAVLSVVIDNDYRDTPAQALEPHATHEGLSPNDILSIILDAALHPDRRVIAVEDNKSEAIAILRRHLPDWPGVELAVLPTRYPQGAEKQLIQAVTGRQVPPGHLPFSVGCAVFNAGTVAAVYRAVYEGKPVTKRIVTVTGEGEKEPKNLIVRIGTPFAQVIEAAGGLTEDACKVLSGGPMMGTAQGELAAPVLKGTNAVLCLTSANPTPERPVCIRCSKCVEVCPMHLQPLYLYRYEAAGNLDALQALHVTDCIECGCCSYTCPGQLPLTERFRAAKQALKEGIRP